MELEEYNNGSSWLISSMSQEELEKAFKGWSMGNECLENLLRTCHNIGLETGGCHVGRVSYLQFYKNDSQKDIIKILNAVQPIKGTAFFVCPDGGNPFSGPSWHRPTMSVDMYTKEPAIADSFFNTITDSILSNDIQPVPGVYSQLLTLHDFFADKISGLFFRSTHSVDGVYKFQIENSSRQSAFAYFNPLFSDAGMLLEGPENNYPGYIWSITSRSPEDISARMQRAVQHIVTHYSLEKPKEEEIYGLNLLALLKKSQFGDSPEGQALFNQWIEPERKRREEEFKRMIAQKNKVPEEEDYIPE